MLTYHSPGLNFWKVPSRKVYAIPERDLMSTEKVKGKGKKRPIILDSSEDSDFLDRCHPPTVKKPKVDSRQVLAEVQSLRQDIKSIMKLSRGMKLPAGLHSQLMETFQCQICHSSPITPPVIYSRCCKRILGCEACVEGWYSGEDGRSKCCPYCRSERAYSETTRLRGLDDFLSAIAPLMDGSESIGDAQPSKSSSASLSVDSDQEDLPEVHF